MSARLDKARHLVYPLWLGLSETALALLFRMRGSESISTVGYMYNGRDPGNFIILYVAPISIRIRAYTVLIVLRTVAHFRF